jgi:hypothetical protein
MKTLKLDFINAKSYIIGLQNVHVRISFYRNRRINFRTVEDTRSQTL